MTLLGNTLKGTKLNGSGENMRDGVYTFLVERLFEQKGYEGNCFIAELRVMTAEPLLESVKPNPVGSSLSVVCNETKHKEVARANIIKICMSVFGLTQAEVEDNYAEIVSEDNPARGRLVGCRTYRKESQGRFNAANKGQILVLPRWECIEQTAEEIRVNCEKLDRTAPKVEPAAKAPAPEPEPEPKKTSVRGLLRGR